jgi:hypothetical protein
MDNPVALPPGRARLVTSPLPTGSATAVKTIGRVLVACLLRLGRERRGERTGQRRQQEAAALHHSIT